MSSAKKLRRPSQSVPVRNRSTSSRGGGRHAGTFGQELDVGLGQLVVEVLTAQHRGLVLLPGVAQQGGERARGLPEVAEAGEVAAVHEAQGQEAAVDAAGAGAGDDVDPGVGLQDVEQIGVRVRWAVSVPRRRLAWTSRLSSRTTPLIQIARLTPPLRTTARRISCVTSERGGGVPAAWVAPVMAAPSTSGRGRRCDTFET